MDINQIIFNNTLWLWGILVVLPIILLYKKFSKNVPGIVAPNLASKLISNTNNTRKNLEFFFQIISLIFLFVSLARPQFGTEKKESIVKSRNIIIAIDTSQSMLAEDIKPSRLTKSKLSSLDIINSMSQDRIAVIAFAGEAFLQAPLSLDHNIARETINELNTNIIPRGGTNISKAINLTLKTIKEIKSENNILIIFSDGEVLEEADTISKITKSLNKSNLKIISVGVGTSEGAIIPKLDNLGNVIPGRFLTDSDGNTVKTSLDTSFMKEVSKQNGIYVNLNSNLNFNEIISYVNKVNTSFFTKKSTALLPIERFIIPLSIAFIFLILSQFLFFIPSIKSKKL